MKFLAALACLLSVHVYSIGQITGIKISGDTCTDFTLDLQALGTSSSPYFFWHFGDPASGTDDSTTITGLSPVAFPTHTFSSPGIYNVCVSFQEPGSPVTTVCRTISIGLCCDGVINFSDSCLQNGILFSLLTGASVNSISWNFGDIASGINNISTSLNPAHQFTSVGTYFVSATVSAGCGTFSDTISVTIVNCSTDPCTGSIVCNDTCLNASTAFQINSSYPVISVNWNFDDPVSGASNTAAGTNANHQFTSPGVYSVKALVNYSCGTDTLIKSATIVSCDNTSNNNCKVSIPNAFSPNGDNINDFFGTLTTCPFEKYELLIYNRWGQQIFQSENSSKTWGGDYKGLECTVGTYGYLLKYKFFDKPASILKGDIALIK